MSALLANPAIAPVVSVCMASLTMTILNKYIVSGFSFTMNLFILAAQSAVAAICIFGAKRVGVISFRDFDWEEAKNWSPVSAALVIVLWTGSKSLQFLSVPVYTIFKNLTIIVVAYGEVLWFGGAVTQRELLSFVLMILSSVIAASGNIMAALNGESKQAEASGDSGIGYFWVLLNVIATAFYILGMRKRIKLTGFKDWDTSAYNNVISIPILLVASFSLEGWGSANWERNFPAESRTYLIVATSISGAAAVFISYSAAWCIRVTSSTTYRFLNKLPVAVSGMVFFGNPVNVRSVSSVLLGFFAGIMYTQAKQQQKAAQPICECPHLDFKRTRVPKGMGICIERLFD
ncbi:UDP-galactose transporter [Meredithblackwellia eburnea MCA 4105]